MFPKKAIFNSLLLTAVVLPNFSPAFAEILFQDNFDNSPDWQSKQTVHKSQPDGYDIAFGMTRSDTCTTHCPPQGWTSYRAASSHFMDNRGKDTFLLNAEGARGGTGKGIVYNVESVGTLGSTWGKWAGGSLDIWLGEQGYKELYVRYYVKFSDNWKWTREDKGAHCLWKMARITTFNDNIWTSSVSPHLYFGDGLNYPLGSTEAYYNAGFDNELFITAIRMAPDYDSCDGPDNHTNTSIPAIGEWHCYEFYRKMNSAPGVANGEYAMWIDGVEKNRRTDVMWKKTGSNTTHNWNWVMMIDNINNSAYVLADHGEITLYVDDVVVSTEYIGTDDIPLVKKSIQLAPPTF